MFLYSYIPFMIMITSTILIVYRLFVMTRRKKASTLTTLDKSTSITDLVVFKKGTTSKSPDTRPQKRTHQQKKLQLNDEVITKTRRKRNQTYWVLMMLNLAFFIFVTPLVAFNTKGFWGSEEIRDICYVLSYMNNCVYFFFYIITCESFREVLLAEIKKTFVSLSWKIIIA